VTEAGWLQHRRALVLAALARTSSAFLARRQCNSDSGKIISILRPTAGLDKTLEHMADHMENIFHVHSQAPSDVSDVGFRISEIVTSQLQLIHEYNNDVPDDRRSWLFVARDFPEYYVNALERLIYPDWHTASFVANPTDASMWGAYGDGQRGACLKFGTRPDKEECRTLDLYRAIGWGGRKDSIVAHYSYVPHRFEEIRYTADFPEIDFFQSLGTIPRFKLEFWYSGKNGERSVVAYSRKRTFAQGAWMTPVRQKITKLSSSTVFTGIGIANWTVTLPSYGGDTLVRSQEGVKDGTDNWSIHRVSITIRRPLTTTLPRTITIRRPIITI
jgi:hypothetical protein